MPTLKDIAKVLVSRHQLDSSDAEDFVKAFVDTILEGLQNDRLVKIKGFGTFKLTAVKDRESINVNTGERILISGHDKITFTPDAVMRDLVNKPFAQFETVVLADDVNFDDTDQETVDADSEEPTTEEAPVTEETPVVEEPVAKATPETPAPENIAEEVKGDLTKVVSTSDKGRDRISSLLDDALMVSNAPVAAEASLDEQIVTESLMAGNIPPTSSKNVISFTDDNDDYAPDNEQKDFVDDAEERASEIASAKRAASYKVPYTPAEDDVASGYAGTQIPLVSDTPIMEDSILYEQPAYIPTPVAEPIAEPVVEAPVSEAPVEESPVSEEEAPVIEEPIVEDPVVELPIPDTAEPVQAEPISEEEPVIAESEAAEPIIEEPIKEEPVQDIPISDTEEPEEESEPVQEPVVEPIMEPLSSIPTSTIAEEGIVAPLAENVVEDVIEEVAESTEDKVEEEKKEVDKTPYFLRHDSDSEDEDEDDDEEEEPVEEEEYDFEEKKGFWSRIGSFFHKEVEVEEPEQEGTSVEEESVPAEEPIAEEPAIENTEEQVSNKPEVELPISDTPEPVEEEPIAEEPVAEAEPIVEEAPVEEPVIEEAPTNDVEEPASSFNDREVIQTPLSSDEPTELISETQEPTEAEEPSEAESSDTEEEESVETVEEPEVEEEPEAEVSEIEEPEAEVSETEEPEAEVSEIEEPVAEVSEIEEPVAEVSEIEEPEAEETSKESPILDQEEPATEEDPTEAETLIDFPVEQNEAEEVEEAEANEAEDTEKADEEDSSEEQDEQEEQEEEDDNNASIRQIFWFYAAIICILIAAITFAAGYLCSDNDWLGIKPAIEKVGGTPADSIEKAEDKQLEAKPEAKAETKVSHGDPEEESKAAAAKALAEQKSKAEKEKTDNAVSDNVADGDWNKDPRVRHGAYKIVGTMKVITVAKGQTIAKICRIYYGSGLECYIEAYNGGIKDVKEGQKLKLPEIKLKSKSKKK